MDRSGKQNTPGVRLSDASLELGGRALWQGLEATVRAGEFVAVLGPNGSGKTSLLRVLLGLLPLSSGTVTIVGQPPRRGNHDIGYIPQQKSFDAGLALRGRDLVRLGVDGHRYGFGTPDGRTMVARRVQQAIDQVEAAEFANAPIGQLSGGQQQRLRIAQALVGQPSVLLCDEPLLSLDLASQKSITALIHDYRLAHQAAVLFVTHDINPILPWVDRILYLANGRWVIDRPDKVLRSQTLSKLYGTSVEVLRVHDRVLVVGADDEVLSVAAAHHAHEQDIGDAH